MTLRREKMFEIYLLDVSDLIVLDIWRLIVTHNVQKLERPKPEGQWKR